MRARVIESTVFVFDKVRFQWLLYTLLQHYETLLRELNTEPKEEEVMGTLSPDREVSAIKFLPPPSLVRKTIGRNKNLQQSSQKISNFHSHWTTKKPKLHDCSHRLIVIVMYFPLPNSRGVLSWGVMNIFLYFPCLGGAEGCFEVKLLY